VPIIGAWFVLHLIGESDRDVIPRWIPNDSINEYVFQLLGIEGKMVTSAVEHELEQAVGDLFTGHADHSGGGESGGGPRNSLIDRGPGDLSVKWLRRFGLGTATNYPADADGDALRKVAEAGADMGRPMVIDFSVDAADESTARRIAELVAPLGFLPSVSQNEDGNSWSVYCAKSMLATYDGVVGVQAQLNEFLRPLGANCDGWGTFGNTQ
jgi:hypothetical protein